MTDDWISRAKAYTKENEGLRLEMYRCPKGRPTIGYGHLVRRHEMPLYKDTMITPEQANEIFDRDWQTAYEEAVRVFPDFSELSDKRKIVMVDMCFQLGMMGLVGFRRMLRALRRRDYVEAADEILDSHYARVDSPRRAMRNARMMAEG